MSEDKSIKVVSDENANIRCTTINYELGTASIGFPAYSVSAGASRYSERPMNASLILGAVDIPAIVKTLTDFYALYTLAGDFEASPEEPVGAEDDMAGVR